MVDAKIDEITPNLGTLHTGCASGRIATPTTRERATTAIGTILTAEIGVGVLRADAHPEDVTALVRGILLSTRNDDASGQTGRLLGLVIDALRPER